MPSVEFLQHLSRKLKTGNRRSIHLNALPGRYATRLDFTKLNSIMTNLGSTFLDTLLEKSKFKFKISFDRVNLNNLDDDQQNELNFIAKKLNGMHYQNNDNYLEHGIKTFGFGFPILVKRDKKDTNKIIKAPLIVWHLDIEKSTRKTNEWLITRDDDYAINLNEVLISHVEQDEDVTLERLAREYFDDDLIDEQEIIEISASVMNQLNTSLDEFKPKTIPCPSRERIENLSGSIPWICWAGVFGLYRAQKEGIITDIDKLISDYDSFEFENLQIESYQTSTVTAVETDPSQEEILNSLTKTTERIIQGPPGTGKSQSLTAVITNAIESGATCLVVCEKKTALDVIKKNLDELDLGGLCAVIDDVSKDRKKIIDRARYLFDNVAYYVDTFREQEYTAYYREFRKLREKINKRHKAVCEEIFGDDKWKDIIGKYLGSDKVARKDILRDKLNRADFEFSFEEYNRLRVIVQEGKDLFNEVNTIVHPLEILKKSIFKGQYLNTVKIEIGEDINKLSDNCNQLISEYMGLFEEYGNRFCKNSKLNMLLISVLSLFSQKYKKLKNNRIDYLQNYMSLMELHANKKYFRFRFCKEGSINDLKDIVDNLSTFRKKTNQIQNEMGTFQEYFEWKSFYYSLKSNQQRLLITLIKSSVEEWDSLLDSWYFFNVLTKHEGELGPFNTNNKDLEKLVILNRTLKEMQINKINDLWAEAQWNSICKYGQKGIIRSLYNYRRNNQYQRRNSLRKIIHADFNLFTDLFPIVMVNPVVASSILPLKEGIFDVVIFDEASQLRLEDTYPSYIRGKYKIISGDVHQMPPSNYFGKEIVLGPLDGVDDLDNEETESPDDDLEMADKDSLLHYSVDSGFSKSFLDFHYRSKHPYLIEYSNAAFYGSRLTPMPEKYVYKPIRFIQVNGLYESRRTNPGEAKKVIEILFKHIQPIGDGDYPSVGIATFNMEQRNLILEMIQDECFMNRKSSDLYEQLKEKGLFVKNLENIQGDERDIMILSTTFGLNSEGKFRQSFGPINQAKGYKLFNVIVTRAKHLLYVCTSIPNDYYNRYREEIELKGNMGKGVLYSYLAYAKAIEDGNEEVRQGILNLLKDHCAEQPTISSTRFVESPFEQEVYDYMIDHIERERIIPQYKLGGFRIDFVVTSKVNGKPIIAIECDGAQYHSSEEAYVHDMFRQKTIEREGGLTFYRIWSTNWWNDPQKEVNKLISFIREIDEKKERSSLDDLQVESLERFESFDEPILIGPELVDSIEEMKVVKSVVIAVTEESTVKIRNLLKGDEMTLKITGNKTQVDLESKDVKVVHKNSPIAVAMMNKGEGEKFRIDGLEVYYEILQISNAA